MTERTLTLRELNRATLARQMLLERAEIPIAEAVERVGGLQAQVPNPPYVGLWTRLRDFRREELTGLIEEGTVVRAAMMRSTLHLVTAEEHHRLRPGLQPALDRALSAFFGKRAKGVDVAKLTAAARKALDEAPRAMGELKAILAEVEPDRDGDALNYVVRTHLPLVQVPPGGTWGSGSAARYGTAESRIGRSLPEDNDPREVTLRHLKAFGPATVKDVQTWSGLTRLKAPLEALKPELRTFRDEAGNELFDLPDAPLPPGDTSAPVRFLPEYDNLLLSHADRTRVIADEHRSKVFLSAARVRATFLVDGFVRGAWKIEKSKRSAALVIEPFEGLAKQDRDALAEEGERLIRFVAEPDGVGAFSVRFERNI